MWTTYRRLGYASSSAAHVSLTTAISRFPHVCKRCVQNDCSIPPALACRQVRSTEQMTAFLAGVIPQDRRRATGPSAALYSPPVQQQQARQGAAGGSQQAQAGNSPGQGQHPLSPPLHKQQSHRKRKRAASGRPPLAAPPQAAGEGGGRRRVGVVFNGEEGRWTAAAAGRDAAGQLVAVSAVLAHVCLCLCKRLLVPAS